MFQKLSFKDYFLAKKRKNKIYIFIFIILSLSIFLYKNKTPLIQGSYAVFKNGTFIFKPWIIQR